MKILVHKWDYLYLTFFILAVITYNYYVQNDIDRNKQMQLVE